MSDDTNGPREAEALSVAVARMEGKIDIVGVKLTSVSEQVSDVSRRTGALELHVSALKMETQQLQSDARAAEKERIQEAKARVETAAALKEQDADRVAKAKAAVDQSAQKWAASPAMKAYITLGGAASAVTAFYYLTHPHG